MTRNPNNQQILDAVLRQDFPTFVGKCFSTVSPGVNYQPNWHIRAIAHQLDLVAKGKIKRSMILMPPRSLKSITASVAFPAYLLGQDPTKHIVCISYAEELSQKHARDSRAVMQSAWYRRAFPGTQLSRSKNAELDFETTRRGGRLSTSIKGTITGRGGSLVIIDDPQKPIEAMSAANRESLRDWARNTLPSRLDDKVNDSIILVQQRLHCDDLAGHFIEQGDWTILSLPAVATEDQIIPLDHGKSYHRKVGELLHPEREPQSVIDRLKGEMGSFHFSAQYQQSPLPEEGNLVKSEWLKTYEAPPSPGELGRVVQSWDFAVKDGEANDFTVCITAHVRRNEVRILDIHRKKLDYPAQRRAVVARAQRFNAHVILIESSANGSPLIADLRGLAVPGVPTPIAIQVKGSKVERFSVQSHRIEAGDVMLPQKAHWLDEFRAELMAFPLGRHDDQVDALSQLLQWIERDNQRQTRAICGPLIIYGED